jgi:hypothetical protein
MSEQMPLTPADLSREERATLRRVRSWKRFHDGPRQQLAPLLTSLREFPNCVLVAGCQRSGTTITTRIIARTRGFQRFAFTHDDELDAALILAGHIRLPQGRRYCFQTTYLNERYPDYALMRPDQRLVWVLRNPYSVVYSMVNNWKRFALEELYDSCAPAASARPARHWLWPFGPSAAEKASVAYAAKTAQLMLIRELIGSERLFVLEYDQMVQAPEKWLPALFLFIGEPYDPAYAHALRRDSLEKALSMPGRMRELVDRYAVPTYNRCLSFVSTAPAGFTLAPRSAPTALNQTNRS